MGNDMEDVVLIGFGGHGKSVADSILSGKNYNIIGYTDVEDKHCGYEYLGTDNILSKIYAQGVKQAVLGMAFMGADNNIRDSLVLTATEIGYEFPAIIDPTAVIAHDVMIGRGAFVGKGVIVNSGTVIGDYCIINTGVVVEHDNRIDYGSHIAVGAVLCGFVHVGHHSLIGAGSTVIQGKKIGSECIIGANSTVLSDVRNNQKVYGIVKNCED